VTIHQERPPPSRQASVGVLVEDNVGDAYLVKYMLDEEERTSFEVLHVERLEEALERLRERAFDVVFLDLSLPDSHGLETLFRVQEATPEVPVVVLSGLDDEGVALQALHNGAQDYLVKGRGDGELVARAIRYAMERKRAEERLAYMSQYDNLTGLANRALFQDRLERAIVRADRDGTLVTLLLVDLDRFKAVNDSFGQASGDALLKEAAGSILGLVSESDTVARMGGDEFGAVVEGLPDAQDVVPLAEGIIGAFSEPFSLNGHEVPVTASVGISVYPPSEGDGLLRDAAAAVNRAKQIGRNSYQFYAPEMNVQAFERMVFETSLRRAEEREEFLLYYQPQVDLETGRIVAAEALLRWQHPDFGLVLPTEFIPVLEETGLIVPVGEWVLRTACSHAKEWRDAGIAPLRIAVNLSARQFGREELAEKVLGVLRETGFESVNVELELTEGLLMEDTQKIVATLGELKKISGLKLAVDDFGTGHSSLSYLRRFPLDILKIDRSFVRDIAADSADAAIVAAIIGLTHSLGLRVIAEGVETEEQLAYLREKGCDLVQGYYFSRPCAADEFVALLRSGHKLP
jgi:diguanylate cyclase (GGDEF)-like protein